MKINIFDLKNKDRYIYVKSFTNRKLKQQWKTLLSVARVRKDI